MLGAVNDVGCEDESLDVEQRVVDENKVVWKRTLDGFDSSGMRLVTSAGCCDRKNVSGNGIWET